MARLEIWFGNADDGLTYSEMALVRAERLTATERAMIHTGRARALGKLGRIQETLRAIGDADEEFANARPSEDPAWMRYYDQAQHLGDTGHALWDVAIDGQFVTDARDRLTGAVAGHGKAYMRARAISQTKLASLVMKQDDPSEAATLGSNALDWTDRLRSRRAAQELRDLHTFSRPHKVIAEVEQLRQRISGTVVAS